MPRLGGCMTNMSQLVSDTLGQNYFTQHKKEQKHSATSVALRSFLRTWPQKQVMESHVP